MFGLNNTKVGGQLLDWNRLRYFGVTDLDLMMFDHEIQHPPRIVDRPAAFLLCLGDIRSIIAHDMVFIREVGEETPDSVQLYTNRLKQNLGEGADPSITCWPFRLKVLEAALQADFASFNLKMEVLRRQRVLLPKLKLNKEIRANLFGWEREISALEKHISGVKDEIKKVFDDVQTDPQVKDLMRGCYGIASRNISSLRLDIDRIVKSNGFNMVYDRNQWLLFLSAFTICSSIVGTLGFKISAINYLRESIGRHDCFGHGFSIFALTVGCGVIIFGAGVFFLFFYRVWRWYRHWG